MNGELRRYLEALDGEWEDHLRRHPDEDEMIAYVRGELEAGDAERMRSHLVRCAACAAALKDVADFFEPIREGEEPIPERVLRREWKTLWRRVRAGEKVAIGLPFSLSPTFALAASLLVAVGLTLSALHLWQQRQQLAMQLQTEQLRRQELERENRHLQEQARALQSRYESQLAQLRQPQPNIPVYDVFSQEMLRRSGAPSPVNRVTVSSTTESFSVILAGESQTKYREYEIKIVDSSGQVRWRAVGLRPGPQGNITLLLTRTFLSAGEYRIIVSGQRGGQSRTIAQYILSLQYR